VGIPAGIRKMNFSNSSLLFSFLFSGQKFTLVTAQITVQPGAVSGCDEERWAEGKKAALAVYVWNARILKLSFPVPSIPVRESLDS
jgi:hypothetical protein